ncbi:hypothetical protein OS493_004929 [Desmophyllum pertusum]|uniref:Uncharacterized protein n=1 Tax=Desmophyllum pertusum TaxID=174260 RepID=A0A9X0CT60_9CNID|nr:hypothetical protein OS493_004929 [Desmophyllum pertusum]
MALMCKTPNVHRNQEKDRNVTAVDVVPQGTQGAVDVVPQGPQGAVDVVTPGTLGSCGCGTPGIPGKPGIPGSDGPQGPPGEPGVPNTRTSGRNREHRVPQGYQTGNSVQRETSTATWTTGIYMTVNLSRRRTFRTSEWSIRETRESGLQTNASVGSLLLTA